MTLEESVEILSPPGSGVKPHNGDCLSVSELHHCAASLKLDPHRPSISRIPERNLNCLPPLSEYVFQLIQDSTVFGLYTTPDQRYPLLESVLRIFRPSSVPSIILLARTLSPMFTISMESSSSNASLICWSTGCSAFIPRHTKP